MINRIRRAREPKPQKKGFSDVRPLAPAGFRCPAVGSSSTSEVAARLKPAVPVDRVGAVPLSLEGDARVCLAHLLLDGGKAPLAVGFHAWRKRIPTIFLCDDTSH